MIKILKLKLKKINKKEEQKLKKKKKRNNYPSRKKERERMIPECLMRI